MLHALALAGAGAVAGLAACADGARAPTEARPLAATAPVVAPYDTVAPVVLPHDTVTDVFTLHVLRGGDFRLAGRHWIHFPQDAVCDPAMSGYGPAMWDAPCEPATGKITVTAVTYLDASGHPRIDFTPELRFVPGDKPQAWVYLTMADHSAAGSADATILYCGPGGACVDESVSDATLATHRSVKLGTVSRRIKHFSGYLMSAGRMVY